MRWEKELKITEKAELIEKLLITARLKECSLILSTDSVNKLVAIRCGTDEDLSFLADTWVWIENSESTKFSRLGKPEYSTIKDLLMKMWDRDMLTHYVYYPLQMEEDAEEMIKGVPVIFGIGGSDTYRFDMEYIKDNYKKFNDQ